MSCIVKNSTLVCNIVFIIHISFLKIKLAINGDFFLLKIDGKIANICTNCPSTVACPFCHYTQSKFKNKNLQFTVKDDFIKYGMSLLHFGPNCIKGLLKIASQMSFKKHRCAEEFKAEKDQREWEIKDDFFTKMGVKIDQWFNFEGFLNHNYIQM